MDWDSFCALLGLSDMSWIWYEVPNGPNNMMTDDKNFGCFKTYAVAEMEKGSPIKVWEHTEV